MTFRFKNYQIKSYDYGYMAQRHINNRWKTIGYYQNLQSAIRGTFNYRVLTETSKNIIDALDEASARIESAKLLQVIERIADDLERVVRHGQK